MAVDNGGWQLPFEAGTTTLVRHRFVAVSSTREKSVVFPTTGAAAIGVLTSPSTLGSTEIGQAVTVQVGGVAKVEAAASTVAFGGRVGTDANGRAVALAAGDASLGIVIGGSSGAVNRVFSVLLDYQGSTEALR